MTEIKGKILNKGQLAFIERNKQRIAALPPALCAICNEPRPRKNKYCKPCWAHIQSLQGQKVRAGVPSYAYCTKSPTKAHEWVLDMQSRGKCTYCKKSRQFTAVIGGDYWGHDEREVAYAKARVSTDDYV